MVNTMDKVLLFAATQKGLETLVGAVEAGRANSVGCVVTFKETVAVSFEREIIHHCEMHNIPFFYWGKIRNSLETLISEMGITVVVAIGWRYLLPVSINKLLKYPIIVFHDSMLPKYRGFAPTPTALICGEKSVGVTALFAAEEVDKGEIIWQKEIPVDDDYIQNIIDKQSKAYIEGFLYLLESIDNGAIFSTPQNESMATYSIWRSLDDCKINWGTSAREIYNFVRALGAPYPGAYTHYKNKKIIVLRVKLVPDIPFAIRDYGKLWLITEGKPTIICGSGMIQIEKAIYDDGESVIFDTLREKLR